MDCSKVGGEGRRREVVEKFGFMGKGGTRGQGWKRCVVLEGDDGKSGINLLHASKDRSTFIAEFVSMNISSGNTEGDVTGKRGGWFDWRKATSLLAFGRGAMNRWRVVKSLRRSLLGSVENK